MGKPAAKLGDQVVGTDIHIVMVPSSGGPVPTPMSFPSTAASSRGAVRRTDRRQACRRAWQRRDEPATSRSNWRNIPASPDNRGTLIAIGPLVLVNGKPLAKAGDKVLTCNDPAPAPVGTSSPPGRYWSADRLGPSVRFWPDIAHCLRR